jgi:hypothetical protein
VSLGEGPITQLTGTVVPPALHAGDRHHAGHGRPRSRTPSGHASASQHSESQDRQNRPTTPVPHHSSSTASQP